MSQFIKCFLNYRWSLIVISNTAAGRWDETLKAMLTDREPAVAINALSCLNEVHAAEDGLAVYCCNDCVDAVEILW